MKKITTIIILSFLLTLPMFAASKAKKKFSGKYRDTRLEVVLHDLCRKTGNTLNAADADIDWDKPITATFKETGTSAVLRKVLDPTIEYKVRKGVITLTNRPTPPAEYERTATEPASVTDNDSLTLTIYQDTIYQVQCRVETKQLPDTAKTVVEDDPHNMRGHHIGFWLGAGYGSLGYSLRSEDEKAGTVRGSISALAQISYSYYFSRNWGIQTGVGISYYSSFGKLNTVKQFSDALTDTEGEQYRHQVRTRDWREQQQTYMIDIPLMVVMQYPVGDQARLYAGLGAKIGLPILNTWRMRSGSISHEGYYEQWNLTLYDINQRDFYSEDADRFPTEKQKLSLRMPAVGAQAELGIAIPLKKRLDLLLAIYANYTINNIRDAADDASMGWQQTEYTGAEAYRNHSFMKPYNGEIESEYVKSVHPWAVGLKIGLSLHPQKKQKPTPPRYERIERCDTTYTLRERRDTIIKPRPAAVQQIVRMMEKSVIWFDHDSSTPKLEPADILDRIAGILLENPEQKILVYGHASREGSQKHNQQLSERRAKAVVDMLIQKGVNSEQIEYKGFAADIAYEQGEHAISLDRRVEIIPVE